jgi:hypothetical protein
MPFRTLVPSYTTHMRVKERLSLSRTPDLTVNTLGRNIHHAFLDRGADREMTRILSIYPPSKIPLVNYFDGQGTHGCGLAVGSGESEMGLEERLEIR